MIRRPSKTQLGEPRYPAKGNVLFKIVLAA